MEHQTPCFKRLFPGEALMPFVHIRQVFDLQLPVDLNKFDVKAVFEVDNIFQRKSFEIRALAVEALMHAPANTVRVFNNTSRGLSYLLKNGFDRTSFQVGLYGEGIYSSLTFDNADAQNSGDMRAMLMCKVISGDGFDCIRSSCQKNLIVYASDRIVTTHIIYYAKK
jgi:hypothetical protein